MKDSIYLFPLSNLKTKQTKILSEWTFFFLKCFSLKKNPNQQKVFTKSV